MRSAGSFVKDESGKTEKVEGTDNSGRLKATESKKKKADVRKKTHSKSTDGDK